MTDKPGHKEQPEEAKKAKNTMKKDTPESTETPAPKPTRNEEPEPYRLNENIDNQKSDESRDVPEHNASIEEAPIPGAQVSKDKTVHKENIDKKSNKADPKASG